MSRPPASRLELAIEILAASRVELRALLEAVIAENPALRFAPFQGAGGADEVDAEVCCEGPRLELVLVPTPLLWRIQDPPPTANQKEQADWLCEVLAERKKALERVLSEVVTRQRAYLAGEAAEPSKVRCAELAEALAIAEPTVQRTLQGKHLRTPRGVLKAETLVC